MILKKLISNCILKTFSDKIGRECGRTNSMEKKFQQNFVCQKFEISISLPNFFKTIFFIVVKFEKNVRKRK